MVRKLTAYIVIVALIICEMSLSAWAVTDSPASDSPVSGDVNGNGVLESSDVRYVMRSIIGSRPLQSDRERQAADVNRDGIINSVDARGILVRILNQYNNTLLYSFGVMSDLHLQYATGQSDFQRALAYFDQQQIPFSCVCGDLTWAATMVNAQAYTTQWKGGLEDYKDIKGEYPVYAIGGNHDTYTATYNTQTGTWTSVSTGLDVDLWKTMTGDDPFYTISSEPADAVTHNVYNAALPESDVFIMLSIKYANAPNLWLDGEWEWLQATLEANKHKRCFVFFHESDNEDAAADPFGLYPYGISESTAQGAAFIDLLRQYDNTVWFHGHTHTTFLEEQPSVSYDRGYTSVHVPSLQGPREWHPKTGGFSGKADKSECYVVQAYPDRLVLKALDMTSVNADGTGEATVLETYTIYT